MNKILTSRTPDRVIVRRQIPSHMVGQYSTLRQTIMTSLNGRLFKPSILAFTSCHLGEGVTTIATNFALNLAEGREHKILLVDCNIAAPSLHTVFQEDPSPGLMECLTSESDLPLPVRQIGKRFDVLFIGKMARDPWRVLGTREFAVFLREVKNHYQLTILDCPPMIDVGGSEILSAKSDATILVIESEKTRFEVAQRAQKIITNSGGNIIGVVLNKKKYHIPRMLYKRL